MRESDSDYAVGYGRPPAKNRFKPGQSGNPRGRPKGSKNFATSLEEELNVRVPITENGKRRMLPKRDVIAKQLVNQAASGVLKATSLLLQATRPAEAQSAGPAADGVLSQQEDRQVADSIIQRILRAAGSSGQDAVSRPQSSSEKQGRGNDRENEC